MIIGQAEFKSRTQHARAFDAADHTNTKRDIFTGNIGAGRRKHAFHIAACIGSPADNLHRLAVALIDHADAQTVGIGMLFGGNHPHHFIRGQQAAWIFHAFDFEADPRQSLDDVLKRDLSVEMILEPG